jgi:hypothetical protein
VTARVETRRASEKATVTVARGTKTE